MSLIVNSAPFRKSIIFIALAITAFASGSGSPISDPYQLSGATHSLNATQKQTAGQASGNSIGNKGSISNKSVLIEGSGIDWQSCRDEQFDDWRSQISGNTDLFECATLEIPLQPMNVIKTSNAITDNKPQTTKPTTIQLALSKLPATGNKIGTLISIAGGPGQSGLDVSPFDTQAYRLLWSHFDIVGFAPRGVYPSTPTIECDPEHLTLHPENPENYAKGCWQNTPHDLLAQLGADYAVMDIEAIRQALGEPKINLIGYSYGTKIAALYAERFPQYLRAAVLDGIVNLNETELQMQMNQEASIQQTFERFVTDCRQREDCFFADTATIAEAEAKIARIYHYVDANEVLDLEGQRITPSHLSWTLYGLMAWSYQWPALNELLHQMRAQDFSILKILIQDDKYNIDFDAFTAIDCADRAPTSEQKTHYLADSKLIEAQSTWDNHREHTRDELLDACYYWPIAGSDKPHIPKLAADAPPLLLVAQTNDPATPYANAVAMQHYLKAPLLTRHGDGHTLALFDISPCVDDWVVRYLLDPAYFRKFAYVGLDKTTPLSCQD